MTPATNASTARYCAQCRWYQRGASVMDDRCVSPQNIAGRPDIVRGEPKRLWTFCDYARLNDCGPDAKWFQPKIAAAELPEAGIDRLSGMDAHYMHDMPGDAR